MINEFEKRQEALRNVIIEAVNAAFLQTPISKKIDDGVTVLVSAEDRVVVTIGKNYPYVKTVLKALDLTILDLTTGDELEREEFGNTRIYMGENAVGIVEDSIGANFAKALEVCKKSTFEPQEKELHGKLMEILEKLAPDSKDVWPDRVTVTISSADKITVAVPIQPASFNPEAPFNQYAAMLHIMRELTGIFEGENYRTPNRHIFMLTGDNIVNILIPNLDVRGVVQQVKIREKEMWLGVEDEDVAYEVMPYEVDPDNPGEKEGDPGGFLGKKGKNLPSFYPSRRRKLQEEGSIELIESKKDPYGLYRLGHNVKVIPVDSGWTEEMLVGEGPRPSFERRKEIARLLSGLLGVVPPEQIKVNEKEEYFQIHFESENILDMPSAKMLAEQMSGVFLGQGLTSWHSINQVVHIGREETPSEVAVMLQEKLRTDQELQQEIRAIPLQSIARILTVAFIGAKVGYKGRIGFQKDEDSVGIAIHENMNRRQLLALTGILCSAAGDPRVKSITRLGEDLGERRDPSIIRLEGENLTKRLFEGVVGNRNSFVESVKRALNRGKEGPGLSA